MVLNTIFQEQMFLYSPELFLRASRPCGIIFIKQDFGAFVTRFCSAVKLFNCHLLNREQQASLFVWWWVHAYHGL